jgi:hypothetical protein
MDIWRLPISDSSADQSSFTWLILPFLNSKASTIVFLETQMMISTLFLLQLSESMRRIKLMETPLQSMSSMRKLLRMQLYIQKLVLLPCQPSLEVSLHKKLSNSLVNILLLSSGSITIYLRPYLVHQLTELH